MSSAARKQSENEDAANMTVVKNQEPSVQPVTSVPTQEPELSLEQKIQKVEDLTTLIDKLRKLKETQRNLQTFRLAGDGYSNFLQLRDLNNNQEFKTYNASVIEEVLSVVKHSLAEKIAEIEAQIKF